jgi:hypothetical protein
MNKIWLSVLALTSMLVQACRSEPPKPGAAATVASASRAPIPQKPWFSGVFSGTYDATPAIVEAGIGAVREWKKGDSGLARGAGNIELNIGDDGLVDGTGSGALGALRINGKVESDTLSAILSPNADGALGGVLLAARDGTGFKGSLRASSGDSLTVRSAGIELRKREP